MAGIDYEAEYNNRARVPDHQDIFARWTRDGAAYREARKADASLGEKYGASARQTIDLFPAKAGATGPLAMFIHGGYWRSLEPAMHYWCAKGPNAHGIDVAVAGYDLCPSVTVAAIIEQMRAACVHLWKKRRQRIVAYGHSAGGHLTACLVATDWKTVSPDVPEDLVSVGYAISGIFDMTPLLQVSQNADLRMKDDADARSVSPLFWNVPQGRVLDAVVGGDESSEFLRQSKTVAQAWNQGPTKTRYEAVAGANHFTVVDPLMDPASAMTKRVVELAKSAKN